MVTVTQAHALVTSCPPELGGWAADGRSFSVLDTGRFSAEVIPRAFKHNKWTSFVRQLNNYGFRKISSDAPDAHAYQHDLFTRDDPQLSLISRPRCTLGKSIRLLFWTLPT